MLKVNVTSIDQLNSVILENWRPLHVVIPQGLHVGGDAIIRIENKDNIKITGCLGTIMTVDSPAPAIIIKNSNNIHIKNISFESCSWRPGDQISHVIEATNSNFVLRDCSFKNCIYAMQLKNCDPYFERLKICEATVSDAYNPDYDAENLSFYDNRIDSLNLLERIEKNQKMARERVQSAVRRIEESRQSRNEPPPVRLELNEILHEVTLDRSSDAVEATVTPVATSLIE